MAPLKTPVGSILKGVARVKCGKALVDVGAVVFGRSSAVGKCATHKFGNRWLVGADHPNHARSR